MDPNQQQPQTDLEQQSVRNVSSVNKKTKITAVVLFSFLTFIVIAMLGLGIYYLVSSQGQKARKTFPDFLASIASSVVGDKTNQTNAKISAGIQQSTPIPDPTTNWKTYTNTKYKYEIKYPQMLTDTIEHTQTSNVVSWEFPQDNPKAFRSIMIDPKAKKDNDTLRSVIGYKEDSCKIIEEKIDLLKVECVHSDTQIGTKAIYVGYLHDNVIYIISIVFFVDLSQGESVEKIDFSSEINIFNLMLSSFKFLEGQVILPTEVQITRSPDFPTAFPIEGEDFWVEHFLQKIGMYAILYKNDAGTYLNFQSIHKDVPAAIKSLSEHGGILGNILSTEDSYCVDVVMPESKVKYCLDKYRSNWVNYTCSKTEIKCVKN